MVAELRELYQREPKLHDMRPSVLDGYLTPPSSPDECIFAQTTACLSSDLKRPITPCQFGGTPDCSQCGCIASAGLEALGRYRLPGGLRAGTLFWGSLRVGAGVARLRGASSKRRAPGAIEAPRWDGATGSSETL